ncbi:hypothetical protein SLEP1_g55507 [Rubroshorea leprosula]|uniref:Uncharacterized protein n=1 Tax=Rubroshorea leprosula TaxID=152421 RepID=A0AAV5MHQ2_9ROSI|nr:hypothetical protein SLEP1_g55507 [Rubroshorea leprosula]
MSLHEMAIIFPMVDLSGTYVLPSEKGVLIFSSLQDRRIVPCQFHHQHEIRIYDLL